MVRSVALHQIGAHQPSPEQPKGNSEDNQADWNLPLQVLNTSLERQHLRQILCRGMRNEPVVEHFSEQRQLGWKIGVIKRSKIWPVLQFLQAVWNENTVVRIDHRAVHFDD